MGKNQQKITEVKEMSREFHYYIGLEGDIKADTEEEAIKQLETMQEGGELGADIDIRMHADLTDMTERQEKALKITTKGD